MLTQPKDYSYLIRGTDRYGSGHYGASRTTDSPQGGREPVHREHLGVDLLYGPGTVLHAWEPLNAIRIACPYADDRYLVGLVLRRPDTTDGVVEFKLFYCAPRPAIVGAHLPVGTAFADVQDLSLRYPGIQNHVHLEKWVGGTRVDPTGDVRDLSIPPEGGVA